MARPVVPTQPNARPGVVGVGPGNKIVQPPRNVNDSNNSVTPNPFGGPVGTFDIATGANGQPVAPGQGDYHQFGPAGGGGGGGAPTPDWSSSFFGGFGLPPDVVAQVNKIFAQYSDVNAAAAAALAYIRGTPWYAQTYPGIAEGIQKGVVSNEADYRNLLNQQSQLYTQYLGRAITGGEFAANLHEGVPLSTIGGRLQGAALVGTYGNDWRYTLGAFDQAGQPTSAETKALGEETAGLDSPLGQQVKRRLDLANQRLATVFRGSLATPGLTTANGRLAAPGLAPTSGGTGSQADVAA